MNPVGLMISILYLWFVVCLLLGSSDPYAEKKDTNAMIILSFVWL